VANKALLRDAFPCFLRPELLNQPKKGFVLPVKRWMLGPLRPLCEDALAKLKSVPFVDPQAIESCWRNFLRQPETPIWSRVWVLVVLGYYLERHHWQYENSSHYP
jgi:asparagine synthase (glutamine-hydrolysing)